MIPRFRTALSEPLYPLEQALIAKAAEIEAWFEGQWQKTPPPFYGSVDLRHAGYKLAPVDTNLFPTGFNNLQPEALCLCANAAARAMNRFPSVPRRILIIPENHTRNYFYMENLFNLGRIFEKMGLEARIGSLLPAIKTPTVFPLSNGETLTIEPVRRQGNRLSLFNYDPDLIVVNNVFFHGPPEILLGLEQETVPPLGLGWNTRRKFHHFIHYQAVVESLSDVLELDPWLLNPYFSRCTDIDFRERRGEDQLVQEVAQVLQRTAVKYQEYGISEEPFVIVKADPGTYGIGVMTVRHPREIQTLNRKQRNKMAVGNDNVPITEVLIQEGIYTLESLGGAVAEPVVYMMDRFVVGGFYRVHAERRRDENLNTPGRHFAPLALEGEGLPKSGVDEPAADRFYAYSVAARLALLAAARELATVQSRTQTVKEHQPSPNTLTFS